MTKSFAAKFHVWFNLTVEAAGKLARKIAARSRAAGCPSARSACEAILDRQADRWAQACVHSKVCVFRLAGNTMRMTRATWAAA